MTDIREGAEGGTSPIPLPAEGTLRSAGPVVAPAMGEIHLFPLDLEWKVRRMSFEDGLWITDLTSLGGPALAPPSAVARGPGHIELFMLGTDSALYFKQLKDGEWWPKGTSWEALGTPQGLEFVGAAEPAVLTSEGTDVVALASDGRVYHRLAIPGEPMPWVQVGTGTMPESRWPPRLVPQVDAAALFVTDLASELWYAHLDSGYPAKATWVSLGSPSLDRVMTRPGATLTTSGDLIVFARGAKLGSWSRHAPAGEDFGPWEEVVFGSNVLTAWSGMAFPASGHTFDVLNVGYQAFLHHGWGEDVGFRSANRGTPGPNIYLVGEPYAVSPNPERMDVFVLCTDSFVYQRTLAHDERGGDAEWLDWVQLPLGEITLF